MEAEEGNDRGGLETDGSWAKSTCCSSGRPWKTLVQFPESALVAGDNSQNPFLLSVLLLCQVVSHICTQEDCCKFEAGLGYMPKQNSDNVSLIPGTPHGGR